MLCANLLTHFYTEVFLPYHREVKLLCKPGGRFLFFFTFLSLIASNLYDPLDVVLFLYVCVYFFSLVDVLVRFQTANERQLE